MLYSRVLRDYLLYAADEGVIAIGWSRAILSETVEHLQANNSTFDGEQTDLLIRLFNAAYPHAEVTPTATARRTINQFDMPDEDDRHVLAAAVSARADILCTNNVKDFPLEAMASVRIELLTADGLLSRLATTHPSRLLAAHRTAVARLAGATDNSTVAALRRAKAIQTADIVEELRRNLTQLVDLSAVEVIDPDTFLLDLLDLAPGAVVDELSRQALANRRAPRTIVQILEALERAGAPAFADEVRRRIT